MSHPGLSSTGGTHQEQLVWGPMFGPEPLFKERAYLGQVLRARGYRVAENPGGEAGHVLVHGGVKGPPREGLTTCQHSLAGVLREEARRRGVGPSQR